MRLMTRQIPSVLPGVRGVLRVGRPTKTLLRRLRAGDIAVIDHIDLDRATAIAIRDTGVVAVLNARPMTSGRYPNRGSEVLVDAGITVVDGIGEVGFDELKDGKRARVLDGEVYDGEKLLTFGRAVDEERVEEDRTLGRRGMASHLELFTHNSSELLRREEDVLIHGAGVPELSTPIAGRPVLVVAEHPDLDAQLRRLRRFIREHRPAVVAVGGAARHLGKHLGKRRARGALLVVGGDPEAHPEQRIIKEARDVVLACGSGSSGPATAALERAGVEAKRFDSSLAPEDAALLLAHAHHPSVVVGAGLSTNLTDFLEAQRPGLAGTFLSRLALGPSLVDATIVPAVRRQGGGTRRWLVPVVAAAVALAAGVALGATGPVHDAVVGDPATSGGATTHDTSAEGGGAGSARFVADNRVQLLRGALTGRAVAIVAMPGADTSAVAALEADITAAGGRTTGVLEAQPDLLDPARRQYVDTLATQLDVQLRTGPARVRAARAAAVPTYERIGQVIGTTYAGKAPQPTFAQSAETAAVAMRDGHLLTAEGRPTGPAQGVVVLLGKDQAAPAVTGVVHGLGATSAGVVVAGGTASHDLQALRAGKTPPWLSTVDAAAAGEDPDGADTATGQVTTVLALAKALRHEGGRYGASGFSGLLTR